MPCPLSPSHPRPAPRVLLLILAALAAVAGPAVSARAQPASPAKLERVRPLGPDQRAELLRQLERHAQVLEAQSAVVKAVAKLIGPTVVYIEADPGSAEARKRAKQVEEAGSGVIVAYKDKHYVLTARHVVSGAAPDAIKLYLADGRRLFPTRVWDDAESEVAVMAIDAPDLAAAPLGDSDKLETGDFVLAVGSPFGLCQTVTFGIISGKGRRDLKFGETTVRVQDFLQTDASINPGNSGGPLVNLRGEVVGINTAIASRSGRSEGIGFAIPIAMFMHAARQLIESGRVSRGYLGVTLNSRFGPAMAAELGLPAVMGAHVNGVAKGSPADAVRLQPGDVILEFNGVRVEDDAHLVSLVSVTEIGKRAAMVVFRDRKTFTVDIEVVDRGKGP